VIESEITKMSLFIAKFVLLLRQLTAGLFSLLWHTVASHYDKSVDLFEQVACQLLLLLLVLGHQAFMHRSDQRICVRIFELEICGQVGHLRRKSLIEHSSTGRSGLLDQELERTTETCHELEPALPPC
jgi:hypothetical protein